MSWAARRRLIILLILGGFIALVVGTVSYFSFHKAPSCVDGIQNQNESGIDCGGPCALLCTADEQAPTILSTRAIPNGVGRTDVLAYVENKNTSASAKAVPYTITLYGADQALIQKVTGTIDLPPATIVPVFVPSVVSGNQVVATAFLSIDASAIRWIRYQETRTLAVYDNDAVLTSASTTPRITVTLSNSGVQSLENTRAVIEVKNAAGNSIGASQTVIPTIAGQSKSTAIFTWNQPFSSTAVSFVVTPIVLLP